MFFSAHTWSLGYWAVSCTGYGQQGQTTAAISKSRGGHGPLPLGICEQAPLAAPVTSRVVTGESTATKHHVLLPSLCWEHTHPAFATEKGSGHQIQLPQGHCHFPGPCNQQNQLVPPPSGPCPSKEPNNQAMGSDPAQCLHPHINQQTPYQGDKSMHTLRKETASIQNKSSPHTKKNKKKNKPSKTIQGALPYK